MFIKAEIPEILYATRYDGYPEVLLSYGNKNFYENRLRAVDSSFFKIFSFPFSHGNPDSALRDIKSIVITEKIAEKYFPGENPIGKVLTMNKQREFVVSGVLKNMPPDSNIRFDIAIPFEIRILDNRERGWEIRRIEIKTQETLDKDQKGHYTEKIRRKQLNEIEPLIFHYLDLIDTGKSRYPEMIKTVYPSKGNYLSFMSNLQKLEEEVIQAAITTTRKGNKKERRKWFDKVRATTKDARTAEAERLYAEN